MTIAADATTVAAGPDLALATLFREQYSSLLGTARLLLDDPADAEDVVQEAFVRMRMAWWRLRDAERATAYVRATVLNLCRGRLRRRQVARRHPPAAAADVPGADEAALTSDEHRRLVVALRGLSERQRQCLVLRYYAGLGEAEVAATLGISAGSVKTHVHRGIDALGRQLEDPS